MTYLFIIVPVILICIILIYIGSKVTPPIKEEEDPFIIKEETKFEPEKVTNLHEEKPLVTPKKKYYKKKKKKPILANNAQVEKRPVGRPKKSQ